MSNETFYILKCGQIFQYFCKCSSKLDRLSHQALPVLKPALPFSHKVFSKTFHANNLGLGCLPWPIKSICVIYQFISSIAPAFLSTNATSVLMRSVCMVWSVPFCIWFAKSGTKANGRATPTKSKWPLDKASSMALCERKPPVIIKGNFQKMVLVYKSQRFINHYLSLQAVSDDLFVKKSGQIFKCFANHLKNLTTCIIIKTAAV